MYEYQCSSCGHLDTLLERVGAAASRKCPACGKARSFKKLLSAPSFHLKGTGWYATDFRDNGKPAKDSPAANGKDKEKSKAGDEGAKAAKTKETKQTADA